MDDSRAQWSIPGLNADKLPYKDGTGLPPQGRTVRAAPALPPGGGRLLFVPNVPFAGIRPAGADRQATG
jgi:hypothetical protein